MASNDQLTSQLQSLLAQVASQSQTMISHGKLLETIITLLQSPKTGSSTARASTTSNATSAVAAFPKNVEAYFVEKYIIDREFANEFKTHAEYIEKTQEKTLNASKNKDRKMATLVYESIKKSKTDDDSAHMKQIREEFTTKREEFKTKRGITATATVDADAPTPVVKAKVVKKKGKATVSKRGKKTSIEEFANRDESDIEDELDESEEEDHSESD